MSRVSLGLCIYLISICCFGLHYPKTEHIVEQCRRLSNFILELSYHYKTRELYECEAQLEKVNDNILSVGALVRITYKNGIILDQLEDAKNEVYQAYHLGCKYSSALDLILKRIDNIYLEVKHRKRRHHT